MSTTIVIPAATAMNPNAANIVKAYRGLRNSAPPENALLKRGRVPIPTWMERSSQTLTWQMVLGTFALAATISIAFLNMIHLGDDIGGITVLSISFNVAFIAALCVVAAPFLRWLYGPLIKGTAFNGAAFDGIPWWALVSYGAVPVLIVGNAVALLVGIFGFDSSYISGSAFCAAVLSSVGFATKFLPRVLEGKRLPLRAPLPTASLDYADGQSAGPPRVYVGEATGTLSLQGHSMGIEPREPLVLGQRDLCKNVLTLGEIGAAKTSAVIVPFALQLMDTGTGILFVDGKGEAATPIERAAQSLGRIVKRIGVGALGFNLLGGLTPKQATKIILDALHLTGQTGSESAFWVSSVTTLAENTLGILAQRSETYNLGAAYHFIYKDAFRSECLAFANERLAELQARVDAGDSSAGSAKRALRICCDFFEDVFPKLNEKTRNDINATFGTVLQKFQDPELLDAFCSTHNDAALAELLDGTVFVLDLPLAKYDLAAQFVMLFIKEAVFRLIKSRAELDVSDPRRIRPVAFICDEYQKIVSATDADSLDVMRSLNGVVVAGAQSINAFYRALGDEATTKALLANFVNKICFATSDPDTIDYISSIIGEADIYRETLSYGETMTRSWGGGGGDIGTSIVAGVVGQSSHAVSHNVSATIQRQKVVTAQTFRRLAQSERAAYALAILKKDDTAYDDVLAMPKVYLSDLT